MADNTPSHSEAHDLGEQYKELHEFEVRALTPEVTSTATALFAVVPQGKTMMTLKPYLDEMRQKPERRKGTATLADVGSFVAHVEAFSLPRSAVFANPSRKEPRFVAVYDYHQGGTETTTADWLTHRAVYAPALSDSWKEWAAQNNVWMPQADFAAFIDGHVRDLMVANFDDPDLKTFADLVEGKWANPSDMVRLSRSLQVNVESKVKNAQTLSSGEISIIHEEVHTDGTGAPLRVPNLFTVAIPVFYNGPIYRIAVRLRYRVNNGRVHWMYEMVRPELVFDHAFTEMVNVIKTDTELPVFLGTPEQ